MNDNNKNDIGVGRKEENAKKSSKNPSFLFVIILIIAVIIVAFSQLSTEPQREGVNEPPSASPTLLQ